MYAAERDLDPGPGFWPAYFARSTAAFERMSHMDEHMQGRMLASVFDLLLIEDEATQRSFLQFEIGNHDAYGAQLPMYTALFETLEEAFADACGAAWQPAWRQAWSERTANLLSAIETLTQQA